MLKTYFIFSGDSKLSNKIIKRLNLHFNKPERSCLGEAYNFIKINPREYGHLDPTDFKIEVENSDAIVILWSKECYNGKNEIKSDYVKEELETLGRELAHKYIFPITIGGANIKLLKNGIMSNNKVDLIFHKQVDRFISRLYPYPLNYLATNNKIDQIIVLILNRILSNILSFYKTPLNFNKFYGDDYYFINKIITDYKGGIFFRINDKSRDYAKILDKGLLFTRKSFFATLTEDWFNILVNGEDTSRNFKWMKSTNAKVKKVSDRVIRILIAKGNKSIEKLGKEKVKKVYNANKDVEFYFTNEKKLFTKIFKKNIQLYDFALLDEKLIINADLRLVKTSYLNDFNDIRDFHDTMIEALENKMNFEKKYILNKKQIRNILYS